MVSLLPKPSQGTEYERDHGALHAMAKGTLRLVAPEPA